MANHKYGRAPLRITCKWRLEMAMNPKNSDRGRDANPDPITGAPGAHPVGVGVGAAIGGAAAGAAAGSVAGPVGTVVGAVAGGIAGGYAGKGIAEQIDPTTEDAYWRNEYRNRDYYDKNVDYNEVAPAYRYGWESRSRYQNKAWNDVEPDLERNWSASRGQSKLDWNRAKSASRDAWDRIERALPGGADKDGR